MKQIRAAPKRACRDFFGAGSLCSWEVLSISSRSLCPRTPFLLCSPNQNRHATQAFGGGGEGGGAGNVQAHTSSTKATSGEDDRKQKSLSLKESLAPSLHNGLIGFMWQDLG